MTLDFAPVWGGLPELLKGTVVTIEVTAAAFLLSAVLGLLVGIIRLNPARRVLYGIASAYVAFIRGTPLLVQLFLLFFGLPQFGILLPAWLCGVIGLGIYSGSYVSEVVRGAIQSIDRGQMEAARSLGMSYREAMWEVVLPQAFRRMLPPLGNETIALIKNSALVSLLTIDDVMREGQRIISTSFRALEVYIAVALIYFILTNAATWILRQIEKRMTVERG
ncbi:ABC transporter permease (plasmid) [Azospirillum sp. TSH58]|uniref:Putative glutamine transport system permease protein GlnP n=1 Tax=Azospirillum brasilense TaxID=192 RepID=A0A560CLZ0_AZOBR|nr:MULTISPECIES: amino acid ABC transporter permease [Azospirillum]AWJ82291.1 ABC transporter permease [Azospirillum sp. TSH58]PWC72979.1 ABC transporter permease [Azospirillum sp. TSH58]TWA85842.1 amino acid ABC transporter membrane protein (PAAT family) [Azospirillum brasilense]